MKKRILSLLLILGLLTAPASALTVEQARELLQEHYIDEIPEQVLSQPTVQDILDALGDPYTVYYTAEEYADFLAHMEDTSVTGVGISVLCLETGLLIEQIAPDSPAKEAGLQTGDYIIAVDGQDARGTASELATDRIRGAIGTSVTLTVLRKEETFTVTLTRRNVVFPTVFLEKVEDRVGWIRCNSFGSTTFLHFCQIIATWDGQVDEWVVDLRGNGGGDVNAVLFSAGCFAGNAASFFLRDGAGEYTRYSHNPALARSLGYGPEDLSIFQANGSLTSDSLCVLIDEQSASGSELFCAIIRDTGAGTIVGERSYGKGVAQALYALPEGDALKITTQRAFSTAGATCDKVGILPHLMLDADLADEAAELLTAPVSDEEDVLYLTELSRVLPMSMLTDPANAQTATALLSALPDSTRCILRQDGVLIETTPAQVAAQCGVTLTGTGFSDLEDSPYQKEINILSTFGVVDGTGNGLFQPEAPLTRAAMCALLVKALRFPVPEEPVDFSDVPANAWYTPYVSAMYSMGLVTGYTDGQFHPADPVNHEEFLTVLGRTAQWLDQGYYELLQEDGLLGPMLPSAQELEEMYGSYSAWTRKFVWLCDGSLAWTTNLSQQDARADTTRQEATKSVYQLFDYSGILD